MATKKKTGRLGHPGKKVWFVPDDDEGYLVTTRPLDAPKAALYVLARTVRADLHCGACGKITSAINKKCGNCGY